MTDDDLIREAARAEVLAPFADLARDATAMAQVMVERAREAAEEGQSAADLARWGQTITNAVEAAEATHDLHETMSRRTAAPTEHTDIFGDPMAEVLGRLVGRHVPAAGIAGLLDPGEAARQTLAALARDGTEVPWPTDDG